MLLLFSKLQDVTSPFELFQLLPDDFDYLVSKEGDTYVVALFPPGDVCPMFRRNHERWKTDGTGGSLGNTFTEALNDEVSRLEYQFKFYQTANTKMVARDQR